VPGLPKEVVNVTRPTDDDAVISESPARTEDRAAFLQAVLDAIQEGVFVAQDDRITEVNRALCEIVGIPRERLLGAAMPYPFFPPEELDRIHSVLARLRDVGRGDYELALMRGDGTRFAALMSTGSVEVSGRHQGHVFTVRDISQRRVREDRLTELASRDELTGLLNKRSFLVHLAGEVARARRHGRPVSLCMLDLDGFKRINDENGHAAGDRVLAEAAGRLGALVRTGEHMARVGGDEFGWILPDADAEGAASAVQRARMAVSSEPFRGLGSLSISAGICETDGSIDAAELYRRADRALYDAKDSGSDAPHVY
jgi:diguanylate cyclase (GGDEF)-like protein/PAS domain S-box-containing protein